MSFNYKSVVTIGGNDCMIHFQFMTKINIMGKNNNLSEKKWSIMALNIYISEQCQIRQLRL